MDLIARGSLHVAKVVWRPGHGGFAFTVVCKVTFELLPEVSPLSATQMPVLEADVYTSKGGGLALASDLVPFKKRPEVLVAGHAYAMDGRAVPSLVARLTVGEIHKSIQVVGDQYFDRHGRLSEPERFTRMPLLWERASSGPNMVNPVGRPLGDAARVDAFGRVAAPNLLPAGLRITSRSDIVPPVGFGPIAPSWPSRAACLHRHASWWNPSRWHELPLPGDIDLAYFNAAPPDQQRSMLFGEEMLYLEHLHPRFAHLSTQLAPITLTATVDQGSGPQPLPLRCDTLAIDTDRGLATLVWRAHVLLDHPDRLGRVVVTGPTAPEAAPPAWTPKMSDLEVTLTPNVFAPSPAMLPFSGAGATIPDVGPPSVTEGAAESAPTTAPPHQTAAPVVLPFSGAPAPIAGLSSPPVTNSATEPAPDTVPTQHAAQPHPIADSESTVSLNPELVVRVTGLPFSSLFGKSAPPRETTAGERDPSLPFAPPPANKEIDAPPTKRRQDSPEWQPSYSTSAPWTAIVGSGAQEAQPPSAGSPTASAASLFPPRPSAASESPAPPSLLGVIKTSVEGSPETWGEARSQAAKVVAPKEASAENPEPEVAFDAYPPERCGMIAGRLACEEGSTGDILRAESLDAARWKLVHEHWLDRIRDEAARGRKKLLSDYDSAYVSALEAKLGPLALDDYARLAEAAERSAVTGALAGRGLPENAWPHIHRVWIGRMVKDVRLGKQIRTAIDALRAA